MESSSFQNLECGESGEVMERKHQSASSFADLFGAKHSSAANSSSSGVFSSLLAPSDKAPGRQSQQLTETDEKKKKKNNNGSISQAQNAETGFFDNNFQRGQEHSQSKKSQHFRSYYQEGNVQPFHYRSSIYYGGQDDYSQPQNDQNTGLTYRNRGKWRQRPFFKRKLVAGIPLLLRPSMDVLLNCIYPAESCFLLRWNIRTYIVCV